MLYTPVSTPPEPVIEPPSEEMLALDEALTRLEEADPRQARIVMLRYFAGLTTDEIAAALGISTRTVDREWRFARAYFFTLLSKPDAEV